jgi:aminoglycoside phosphotransferase (APT) family kinase protein
MNQEAPVLPELAPLLSHLAEGNHDAGTRGDWRYTRASGGANNLVYRATSPTHDLAIKWAIRDERDRAGREWAALHALRAAGFHIAPAPILLDRERFAQPLVVQSWLAGPVLLAPPASDAEWHELLAHYLAIHSLTPENTTQPIQPAVLNATSAAEGLALIAQQLARIPAAERPPELVALARHAETRRWPEWPAPGLALCRVDGNTSNFVRQPGGLASVDWENSGWGDPAFEIVDLIAYPAYEAVPATRREWLLEEYARLRGEPAAARRMRAYLPLMLVWWVARFARLLYEVPRGGDQRLAARPAGWQEQMRANMARYAARARAAFAEG